MGFSMARPNKDGKLVGGYAKIWSVVNNGNYSTANVSTSKKNAEGNYETDFTHKFVRLVGHAHALCKDIGEPKGGVTIQILNAEVTSKWDAEKKKEYTNYVIFDLARLDGNKSNSSSNANNAKPTNTAKSNDFVSVADDDDDELPFD